MKKYQCMCDMGSMKIMFDGGSAFFDNEFGDGFFDVIIYEGKDKIPKKISDKLSFQGHFTVIKKAWLMAYDCNNKDKLYEFDKGRWWVQLNPEKLIFYISKEDNSIEA